MADKQFNLQLTIQKLEEELSLYRNGTTGSELLELIQEKDSELTAVKTELAAASSELSTVKSNFSTLIKSSRKTLTENESLKKKQEQLQAEHDQLTSSHREATAELEIAANSLKVAQESLDTTNHQLTAATQRAEEDANMISKLQEQGIGYVKKLNMQYSQIKDLEQQLKISENKLQAAEIDIWKDKEKITELQLEFREQSNAYLKDKASHRDTIAAAHTHLSNNVKKLEAKDEEMTELKKSLQEKDEILKRAVVEKDDVIRELKRQVDHLERNNLEQHKSSKCILESREAHWKNEANRLQKLNETDAARIKKFESERANLSLFKRDMDTLKARNQELEDKIKRQEQYMKHRLLRDRGNVMSVPEGSSKPKPIHTIPLPRGSNNI